MFDVAIIGAGPSGLAAAVRLAHFGVKTCIVEAHTRLGGLNSWHTVKGVEISSGLHAFTNFAADGKGGALGKLLRQLRVKFSDLRLYPQKTSSIRFPSARLRFGNDPELLRQQIALTFPADIDAFDRLRRRIRETDEGEITDRQTSARAAVESFIDNPLLVDMLFCPVMFYGNPGGVGDGLDAGRTAPDMDWLLFCVVWKCIFESGLACPAGGMRPLWEELAQRFRRDGGELILGIGVERIAADAGGGSLSLLLSDGRVVEAKTVFSSAGRLETETLLGGEPDRAEAGSVSIVEGVSVLDRPSAEAGLDDTAVFYSFDDRLAFACGDGLVQRRNGVLCAMDNYDLPADSVRPVLKMTHLASYDAWKQLGKEEYRSAKRTVAVGMAEDLVGLGVDLAAAHAEQGGFGLFDDVFTPLTLERYAGHVGGALYGSPRKSRSGATGDPRLFLIGTDQGFHGIVGAMLSGVAMANMHVLAKQR